MIKNDNTLNVNYNTKKLIDELRSRLSNFPEIDEIVNSKQIKYKYSGEDFCVIKFKKDLLEIDFKDNKILEDPMEFSWKIKPSRDQKFNRRMQLKNVSNIDVAFGLIFQSYNSLVN